MQGYQWRGPAQAPPTRHVTNPHLSGGQVHSGPPGAGYGAPPMGGAVRQRAPLHRQCIR